MSYNLFNLSLDFLQKMSREQAMEYFRYGDGLNYKQLVANIIQASTALHWDETRGVREFWYNPIKPIVLRLFPEIQTPGGDAKKEKQFNAVLSEMVKAKHVKYKQLGIVDYRTMRQRYENMDKANCWSNVILFVEKDSAYVHLRPLSDLLNFTILSGAGWSNTAAAESLCDQLDTNREYEVYGVSDHDPYGDGIGKEASAKLEKLGLKIKKYQRIGISPEQLSEEVRDSQKYPVKMTLNSAPQWCEEHGLEGPHRKIYKTVTKNEVQRKILIYEGTKCYGLEIEAISGQPGGPKMLRRIVLNALLEHLDENDRIDELLTDRWENIDQEVLEFHLDRETLDAWNELGVDRTLIEYLTSSEYESRSEKIETEKFDATEKSQLELDKLEAEIKEKKNNWDNYIAEEYGKFQEQIDELRKKYILPIEEERDGVIGVMRDFRKRDLNPLEFNALHLEDLIAGLEAPYDTDLSYLEEEYQKSRALFAEAVLNWLLEHTEYYYDLGRTEEDLSFGLMTGYLMEAMENGETIKDLIERVAIFDSERACEYISLDIDEDPDIQGQIYANLQGLIAEALKGARAR
ncbi:hypothetical protein ES703_93579 [subsurface metagenome]